MTAPVTWGRPEMQALVAALGQNPDLLDQLSRTLVDPVGLDAERVVVLHQASDVDGSAQAQHHTLGAGAAQAAAGSHTHDPATLVPVLASWSVYTSSATPTTLTTEAVDTQLGYLSFLMRPGRDYTIAAQCGLSSTVGPWSAAVRIRGTNVVQTAAPVNPGTGSATLAYAMIPEERAGGPGQVTAAVSRTLRAGREIVVANNNIRLVTLGLFVERTSGTGATISIATLGDGIRELTVTEKISKTLP